MKHLLAGFLIPTVLAGLGVASLVAWTSTGPTVRLMPRNPGQDGAPPLETGTVQRPHPMKRPQPGEPVTSQGQASKVTVAWPWFRGRDGDGIGKDGTKLARGWPAEGPRRRWSIELGEGYAAPAVSGGRVYVLDHVHDDAVDLLRGLSKDDCRLLADALAPLSPGQFSNVEPVLRRLFPTGAAASDEGRAPVAPAQYEQLKQALRELLTAQHDELIRALREHTLDDIDRSADTMRCLSLDDGRDVWRNSYRVPVPRDHGMSRTIPAVVGDCVISLGPQCQVVCWDAETGKARWLIDMVLDHGATVPQWYAGQCPFVDSKTDRLVLAPGGKALVMAVDYRTGKVLWESPNPHGWAMTHASITPLEFAGRRMYVYCGKGGVAGVAADSGEILWDTPEWQIAMATCPSPVVIGDGRLFFSGGYNAGAMILQLQQQDGRIVPRIVTRLTAKQFGSEQQTPVLWKDHLYGVRQNDKKLVCLDLNGKEVWSSGQEKFGSGPYMIAEGLLYVMGDKGVLTMAEATPAGYKRLARAEVIPNGQDSWGPMALVAGRLIVRDLTRMVCLDVAERTP
jgi:outer membrane protein assembly factor BamB